jgi:hypothetical protein
MFVHAREHDNPSNMRYMGLTLGKYIPNVGKSTSTTWAGAFTCRPVHLAEQQCGMLYKRSKNESRAERGSKKEIDLQSMTSHLCG